MLQVAVVAEVAKRYGIRDPVSNEIPPSIRSVKFLLPSLVLGALPSDDGNESGEGVKRKLLEDFLIALSPDVLLPMSVMAGGAPARNQ
jgi:hypothetical protein